MRRCFFYPPPRRRAACLPLAPSTNRILQSEVEDTLQRVKYQAGVEGYVICNRMGNVLRRFPAMSQEKAEQFAESLKHLAWKARSTVRDLEPANELRYLRIRAKRHEVLVAFDNEFLVIVIQRWTPGSN